MWGLFPIPCLFLSGMIYYFYFKYGEIRPFQWDDYLVFGAVIILGFATRGCGPDNSNNFQVEQLESCLQEIDEDGIKAHHPQGSAK